MDQCVTMDEPYNLYLQTTLPQVRGWEAPAPLTVLRLAQDPVRQKQDRSEQQKLPLKVTASEDGETK